MIQKRTVMLVVPGQIFRFGGLNPMDLNYTAINKKSDPEFILYNARYSRVVEADEYCSTYEESGVGVDGDHTLGELRPHAAGSSLELVANIQLMMDKGFTAFDNNIIMLSGHYKHDCPLGGHVHLTGIPQDKHRAVSQALDSVMYPLSYAIDDQAERQLRKAAGYGYGYEAHASDWIEYRMPGSWLLSPSTAFVNLWLCEATLKYILKQTETGGNFPHIEKLREYSTMMENEQNPYDSRTHADIIDWYVSNLPAYKDKSVFVKIWKKILEARPLPWHEDVLPNWGLRKRE